MNPIELFSEDYAAARAAFLERAAARRAEVQSFVLNRTGPSGETLATDVAVLGPMESDTVVVISSGVHGPEGYVGSAIQNLMLDEQLDRLAPVTVVLVHAVNPFGYAWSRRVNEDGIDINRNFVDFTKPRPLRPAYDELHDALVPTDWAGPARAAADARISRYIELHGQRAFQAAVTTGQYGHPDGICYGGDAPCWSNAMFRGLLGAHVQRRRHIVHVDLHTGLGLYGEPELIYPWRNDPAGRNRVRSWFDYQVACFDDDSSVSVEVGGSIVTAFSQVIGTATFSPIVVEYGTVPFETTTTALRGDIWLWARSNGSGVHAAEIQSYVRRAFFPDEEVWKRRTLQHAGSILREAFAGIRRLLAGH